jgi:glycosyltransferase involved in cell wall biosynthesis
MEEKEKIIKSDRWIIFNTLYAPHPINRGSAVRIIEMATYLRKYYHVGIYIHIRYSKINELEPFFDAVWSSNALSNAYSIAERFQNIIYTFQMIKYLHNKLVINFKAYSIGMLNYLCDRFNPHAIISEYVFPVIPAAILCKKKQIISIVDSHDLQYLRKRSEAHAFYRSVEDDMRDELQLLKMNDVIIAIQKKEAEELVKQLPDSVVILAEHPCAVSDVYSSNSSDTVILFTASNAKHNVDSILKFINEIWPKVLMQVRDAELHICGQVCNSIKQEAPSELNIILHGFCESLHEHYSKAAIVINPIIYGSGLKIKTVEAIVHHKCIVTTPIGIEGLEKFKDDCFSVCDFNSMDINIVNLLKNRKRRMQMEKRAKIISKNFTPEICYKDLIEILKNRGTQKCLNR